MSSELTLTEMISDYTVLCCRPVCACAHTYKILVVNSIHIWTARKPWSCWSSWCLSSTDFLANTENKKEEIPLWRST